MKTLTSILLFPICLFSQVGINTTNPIAALDIEGNLRIAITDEGSDLSSRDSLLVLDGNQIIRLISSKKLFSNIDKSLVKGNVTSGGSTVSISSGDRIIPFSSTEFDLKNEFNTTTHEFTAADPGFYRIAAQIKQGTVSAGDYGLSLYKIGTSGSETLLARERYLNINISVLTLNINISSPMRRVETITFLDAGEQLRFRTNSAVSLSILTDPGDTFFTIEQIR